MIYIDWLIEWKQIKRVKSNQFIVYKTKKDVPMLYTCNVEWNPCISIIIVIVM